MYRALHSRVVSGWRVTGVMRGAVVFLMCMRYVAAINSVLAVPLCLRMPCCVLFVGWARRLNGKSMAAVKQTAPAKNNK